MIDPHTYDLAPFRQRTRALALHLEPLGEGELILATNTKTRFALDLPLGLTCDPTPICPTWCYALLKTRLLPQDWVVEKQIKVLRYLCSTEPEVAADRIYQACLAHGLSFLRWFGCGDLVPRLIPTVKAFVRRHPDIVSWISSRKPKLALALDLAAYNQSVILSLDSSEESARRFELVRRERQRGLRYSFLRTDPRDRIPADVWVVYNAQQAEGALPVDDHPGVCPADGGLLEMLGACELCRRCFTR